MKNIYEQSGVKILLLLQLRRTFKLAGIAFSIIIIQLLSTAAFAQSTVSGRVVSSVDDEPVIGANVVIKGTNTGVITDINGQYTIKAANDDILVFSYIGFESREVAVGNQSVIDVKLNEDIQQLDEIVVIGYGEVNKSDLTGSVVSVKGDKLNQTVASGIDQALIGRVAGITATQMSGQPGASVSIRVRGTSSVNGDLEPLYVIDGVPISGNNNSVYDYGLGAVGGGGKTTFSPLSALNPNDIESIEVLKDASATAIYGNRGSNGVIIITTKRGKRGDARISFDGYYGTQEMPFLLDMMNLREYAEYRNDFAAETAGEIPDPNFADPTLLGEGTNWQEEIFRIAPLQNYQLTISGGDKMRYAISGGYFDQEGVIVGSDFSRYSMRINLDSDLKEWLKIGNSLQISRTSERLGQFSRYGIIETALKARPDVPARNFDGSYASSVGEGAFENPIARALDRENYLNRVQLLGNLFADIKIMEDLNFRTEFGGNADLNSSSSWVPTYNYGGGAVNNQNSIRKQDNKSYFWQFKNYLTYTKRFAEVHNLTVMVGQEASEWGWSNVFATGKSLPTNDVKSVGLGDPEIFSAGDAANSGALESYYGRINYDFDDKYYVTFTYRTDGSSNFDKGNKWGYFPSAAFSWRVSNEPFFASLENVMSNFKVRAGWGQTGNAGTMGGFRYGSRLATLPTNLGLGFRVANHANPDLTWETAEQINLGFDVGFINDRLELTVDLYQKTVKDLLLPSPMPSYMGSLGNPAIALAAPWGNFGELENKGIEIELRSVNLTGPFEWSTDLNFTRNINNLISLGIEDAALDGFVGGSGNILVSRTIDGMPLGEFYGYKVVGVFQDKEDILNSPVQYSTNSSGEVYFERDGTVWPGDLKFADIDGNDTIDVRDRTFLGSPQPDFTFGFNNHFRYKGFELGVFVVGSYGNLIYNALKQGDGSGLADMRSAWNNQLQEVTRRTKLEPIDEAVDGWWQDIDNVQVANPGSDIPRATYSDPNQNARVSDRYLEDGSYLRFRNIELAYNFASDLLQNLNISRLRVYGRVQNAFTITKYSGFDPEVGQDTWDPNLFGVDNGRYPSPRMYTLGLNVEF